MQSYPLHILPSFLSLAFVLSRIWIGNPHGHTRNIWWQTSYSWRRWGRPLKLELYLQNERNTFNSLERNRCKIGQSFHSMWLSPKTQQNSYEKTASQSTKRELIFFPVLIRAVKVRECSPTPDDVWWLLTSFPLDSASVRFYGAYTAITVRLWL